MAVCAIPLQLMLGVLRAFGARGADGASDSDGYLNPQSRADGDGRVSPALGVQLLLARQGVYQARRGCVDRSSACSRRPPLCSRDNFVNTMVFSRIPVSANAPTGTALDLRSLQPLASTPAQLVDALDTLLLHATMSADMRQSLVDAVSAVPASNSAKRVHGPRCISLSRRRSIRWRDDHEGDTARVPAAIGRACAGYALGAAAFIAGVQRFSLINALAQGSDYKALVCVFLGRRQRRQQCRSSRRQHHRVPGRTRRRAVPSGLAIAQDASAADYASRASARVRVCTRACTDLADTVGRRKSCRSSANVGPLVVPLTRERLPGRRAAALPAVLPFGSGRPVAERDLRPVGQTGWGGRTADRFPAAPSGLPDDDRAVGRHLHARGQTTSPSSIAPAPTALNQVLVLNGFGSGADDAARARSMEFLRTDRHRARPGRRGWTSTTDQAVRHRRSLNSDVTLGTVFPNTTLGNQLKQVAKWSSTTPRRRRSA